MFKADVYRIAIHSLGAILEEEHLAQMTIVKWNEENAVEKAKLFLQVPSNSNVIPDLNVVIVDSYIDTAKVDKIIATGKPVVLLFCKYHDPKNSMQTELDAIELYRDKVKFKCTCINYQGKADFVDIFTRVLQEECQKCQ